MGSKLATFFSGLKPWLPLETTESSGTLTARVNCFQEAKEENHDEVSRSILQSLCNWLSGRLALQSDFRGGSPNEARGSDEF
jgi:hypothetical protein